MAMSAGELFAQEIEGLRPDDADSEWDWPALLLMYVSNDDACEFAETSPPEDDSARGKLLTDELPAFLLEHGPLIAFALLVNGSTPGGEENLAMTVATPAELEQWEASIIRRDGQPPQLAQWDHDSIVRDPIGRGIYAAMASKYRRRSLWDIAPGS
jgi:hypothetical protein